MDDTQNRTPFSKQGPKLVKRVRARQPSFPTGSRFFWNRSRECRSNSPNNAVNNSALKLLVILAFGWVPIRAEQSLSHQALFAPNKEFPYFEANPFPSEAVQDRFDLSLGRFLAEASLLCYVKETDFIESALLESGFDEVLFFAEKNTFAYLAIDPENLVLVFRGSEASDPADFFTNTKTIQKPFLGLGTAHLGFIEALDWVSDDLSNAIEERGSRNLWLSGHSLGGALATLFALRESEKTRAVYTFGAPRIGGFKLAQNADEKISLYRIVYDNDIIPRVPSPPFYRHFGTTHFISSDHELIQNPPFAEKWESRRKGHVELIESLFKDHWLEGDFKTIPSDYVVDHSPRRYVEALAAAKASQD